MHPQSNPVAIDPQQPWYRQFWPWFLLILPGIAVVACLISLNIALRHGDSPVRDSFRKEGFAISRSAQQERRAAAQGLRAEIAVIDGFIAIELDGAFAQPPESLSAQFIHPLAGARDFTLLLHRVDATRYRAELPTGSAGRWIVELCEPGCTQWRLRGAIDLGASDRRFRLQP